MVGVSSSVGYRSVAGLGPGLRSLVRLEGVRPADVPSREVIERIGAWQKLKNRIEAGLIREMRELAWRRLEDPGGSVGVRSARVEEFAADEVALALTWSPGTARIRLEKNVSLEDRLPRVVAAMWAGDLDYARADAIWFETLPLDEEDAARVADEILKTATGLTTGQVRAQAKKAALAIRPKETVKAAKKRARRDRDVRAFDRGDGNADLNAVMGSGAAAAIMSILNSAAWQAKKADRAEGKDVRSIGEARVDALVDLVLGHLQSTATTGASSPDTNTTSSTHPDPTTGPDHEPEEAAAQSDREPAPEPRPGVKAVVNVTITLAEFLKLFQAAKNANATSGKDDTSDRDDTGEHDDDEERCSGGVGEIEGLGYVPAWVARDLVADFMNQKGTGFRAVIFDEETGTFLAASSTAYRSPAALERHIKLRDRTCRFPGCRQPAKWCDIDHGKPWHKGGLTTECNLMCLCRHHHRLKQSPAWRVLFENGISTWTTRTGHTYTSRPHDYRQPAPPPPLARRRGQQPPDEPDPDNTGPDDNAGPQDTGPSGPAT